MLRIISTQLLLTLSLSSLAKILSLTLLRERAKLNNKPTPLNRVDENETRRESVVTPSANESHSATAVLIVVFGVNVKPAEFLNIAAGGVFGDAGDVEDADAGAVVGEGG